jgi:hypothetical protein
VIEKWRRGFNLLLQVCKYCVDISGAFMKSQKEYKQFHSSNLTFPITDMRQSTTKFCNSTPSCASVNIMMSPTPTKYTPRSSPPILCRNRKRLRRSPLNPDHAEDYHQLIFPDFDDEDIGKPKKICLVQRLKHPDLREHHRRNLFGSSPSSLPNRSVSLSSRTPKEDPRYGIKRSSPAKIQENSSTKTRAYSRWYIESINRYYSKIYN